MAMQAISFSADHILLLTGVAEFLRGLHRAPMRCGANRSSRSLSRVCWRGECIRLLRPCEQWVRPTKDERFAEALNSTGDQAAQNAAQNSREMLFSQYFPGAIR